jgi:L-ascorbate metabolism protein UlaG (beta-lactamase superfamily)
VLLPRVAAEKLGHGTVMENGDVVTVLGLRVKAVPAYNLVHRRPTGVAYHPRGVGNGYLVDFGDTRVYVAGDTENTPEMKSLKDVDVAFLPMNLPYTMTPEMVADAAKALRPRILYPYHYGRTDPRRLLPLLANEPEIEVRIRRMR